MNMFKIVAVSLALVAGAGAQATTLTFDGLNTTYGDGSPVGTNMTTNGQYLAYSEGGYVLTLQTANAPDQGFGAHIGDAGSNDAFNWHDDGDNLSGAFVTLTKVGGGKFNLAAFDFYNDYTGLTVSNGTDSTFLGNGPGTFAASYRGVTSVTFSSNSYSDNQLDDIQVTGGVPEPTTWALMIGGFGMIGFAMRRRSTTVTA